VRIASVTTWASIIQFPFPCRAAKKASALTVLPCCVMMFGMPGTPGFREFEHAFANSFKVLRQQAKLLTYLLTIGLSDMEGTTASGGFLVTSEQISQRVAQFNDLLMLDKVSCHEVVLFNAFKKI
jgi:hypothetical protein